MAGIHKIEIVNIYGNGEEWVLLMTKTTLNLFVDILSTLRYPIDT